MKHTKGPWKIDEALSKRKFLEIYSIYGRRITRMIRHPGDEPEIAMKDFRHSKQDEADANLIAAAPELLEALEYTTRHLEICYDQTESNVSLVRANKDLIAKARGVK